MADFTKDACNLEGSMADFTKDACNLDCSMADGGQYQQVILREIHGELGLFFLHEGDDRRERIKEVLGPSGLASRVSAWWDNPWGLRTRELASTARLLRRPTILLMGDRPSYSPQSSDHTK